MSLKVDVLIWNVDDIYNELEAFYQKAVEERIIKIIGYRLLHDNSYAVFQDRYGESPIENIVCDKVIVSSINDFWRYRTDLINIGIPNTAIVDGRVFAVNELDIEEFFISGNVLGKIDNGIIADNTCTIYPRKYSGAGLNVNLGRKSYIVNGYIEGCGNINVGNFSAISWQITFELGLNEDHNMNSFTNYGMTHFDWSVNSNLYDRRPCSINIGSDVWIGRGCRLKSINPDMPLNIGNGAVIAADSVVVKSVPPYAIVGGNPAQIIRYRFNEKKIKELEELQWWDWEFEKIQVLFQKNNINKYMDDLQVRKE